MIVNTAALKTFAPAMRRQLMEAVGRKLDLLLNSQTPDTLSTYAKQIAELRDEQEKSREQLLERVAYTWFNRLCALRYLDAKGWHPFGCKVLMPADGSETQPELLKLMRSGSLPADLKAFTNEQRLNQLLDGQIPTAIPGGDAQGEVYRELVLAACRSYHQLLPDLFEGLDDASELLLPDDLLTEGSIVGSFRSSISDSDCEDVEIIGWLYQFYISEKKDEVIGKVVKSEDIPAATQLFTPNWIVKYMVQNTIGAQWLATYPDSPLREQMDFYIEPAEQTDEVKAKLAEITPTSLNPEELTLMDPACGSGHILVEAYEIFKAIYLEQGYQLREIPKLILEKNLFGLDIDQRAAQLSSFALIMKGRTDDRKLLEKRIDLNILKLANSNLELLYSPGSFRLFDDLNTTKEELLDFVAIFKNAETFGSLIEIPEKFKINRPHLLPPKNQHPSTLLSTPSLEHLKALHKQAGLLSKRYDYITTNPPYMGNGGMTAEMKRFTADRYRESKHDLFSCFIKRSYSMCKPAGLTSMVTMQGWMFLSSFEQFRREMASNKSIKSLLHIGFNSFPSMNSKIATAAAFTLSNKFIQNFTSSFIDLNSAPQSADKEKVFKDQGPETRFQHNQNIFASIPGATFSYWITEAILKIFANSNLSIASVADPKKGLITSDDERFFRQWTEVDSCSFTTKATSGLQVFSPYKWVPLNKGGAYRKWFGNLELAMNWGDNGKEMKEWEKHIQETRNAGGRVINENFYFKEGVTWSDVTSGDNSFRLLPFGAIFNARGPAIFGKDHEENYLILGFLNSKVSKELARSINQSICLNPTDVGKLPCPERISNEHQKIIESLIRISRQDWDQSEKSWGFSTHRIFLNPSNKAASLEHAYTTYRTECEEQVITAMQLEEKNNSLFIEAYSLEGEIDPKVSPSDITLLSNPCYRYGPNLTAAEKEKKFRKDTAKELISYATGCMMGRYSLDQPGLILADSRRNQEEQLAAYEAKICKPISEIQFKPDADAIIPVLDGEWFEDDIVARTREFLKVTFPESSVAENLRFIEDSIGKDIRKYFCKDFYKDHLQTYKKRPIYWMVQSPKAGFACLIYLHRYTPDTLLQVLNNYFRPYLQKLEARQEQLERDQSNDALPKREQTAARKETEKITKVLKECQAWEQDALLPLAQQRIELDLDDGVKVNYLKLKDVLQKIPGLAAKGD